MTTEGIRLRSFTCSEKLKIIKDAEEHGNRASARKFDVSESCIRDWRKKKELLLNSNGNRRAFRGQKAKFPIVEAKLTEYFLEKREQLFSRADNGTERRPVSAFISIFNYLYFFLYFYL